MVALVLTEVSSALQYMNPNHFMDQEPFLNVTVAKCVTRTRHPVIHHHV